MRKAWDVKRSEPAASDLLARWHSGVSLQYTAGENPALKFRGGDTLRGNKQALDISRHHCISRNLLLFASRPNDGQSTFRRGSENKIFNKKKNGQ